MLNGVNPKSVNVPYPIYAKIMDKGYGGKTIRVMLYIINRIGVRKEFKRIPQIDIANDSNLHKSDISRAIKVLLDDGLLERNPISKQSRELRVVHLKYEEEYI